LEALDSLTAKLDNDRLSSACFTVFFATAIPLQPVCCGLISVALRSIQRNLMWFPLLLILALGFLFF